MKHVILSIFLATTFLSYAQSDEFVVPENTPVSMELTQEIREGRSKTGEAAKFIVSENVTVNGTVVISKGTPVHAVITSTKRGEIRLDIYDVPAVDGTVLKLSDCWIFTTAAQNLNGHAALLIKGTRKNCSTFVKATIKKSGK